MIQKRIFFSEYAPGIACVPLHRGRPGLQRKVEQPSTESSIPKARAVFLFYQDRIKPHLDAEREAGNIAPGGALAASCKLSKELLEMEDADVKQMIDEMYELQQKGTRSPEASDAVGSDEIQSAIDDLPSILVRFAEFIKARTGFTISFICAGPDPSKNWDITSLSFHPHETPEGNTFGTLFPGEENVLLCAYQDFAELLFSKEHRDPAHHKGDSGPEAELDDHAIGFEEDDTTENQGETKIGDNLEAENEADSDVAVGGELEPGEAAIQSEREEDGSGGDRFNEGGEEDTEDGDN
ncbi:hypothetical protein BDN67DRAFT_986155, partial [Paxillus ammoniavirescens]